MKDLILQCAEEILLDRLKVQDGKVNYVLHTGVYHPKKPGQIRVVFVRPSLTESASMTTCCKVLTL